MAFLCYFVTNSWEQRKVSSVAGVYDGVHQTPDYQDDGIMFLSVENISTLRSEKFISEEAFKKGYKVYPEKGDILMTRIGDVGTPNVVETSEKIAFYVSLALLKPHGVDSYFLKNAIQSSRFQQGLKERTLLTAIPMKINKNEIGKVDVSISKNHQEQKQIGCFCSWWFLGTVRSIFIIVSAFNFALPPPTKNGSIFICEMLYFKNLLSFFSVA